MLGRIMVTIRDAQRPMCLADLSRELDLDEPALEGMLDTLIARGRLRAIEFVDPGCGGCPIKSGCFIMNDGVAKTYALAPDRSVSEAALSTFRSGVAGHLAAATRSISTWPGDG
jgi:hypothetical protein